MERTHLEQWKAREVARLLALVETERRYYQEIVASVPVGLLVLGTDLSVISCNREVRAIFGLRSGEAMHGKLDTLLPEAVLDRIREVLKTGNPESKIPVHIDREGGKNLRLSIQSVRNWSDETEQEALVTIEDLSGVPAGLDEARSTPTSQLESSAVPASELLENLDAIVWVVDLPSKRFLYVNDKAHELLGYAVERWLNVPEFWEERIHPEDREWVLASYERAFANWVRHSCEYRAQTSQGKVVWLRENARLLLDPDGRTRHLIGIAVEATQRRMLEDQLIRSQRVDALAKLGNRVSHEVHNLLMVISGYGEELLQGVPSLHPLHSDLQEILSAADRLRGLANQLALYGRTPVIAVSPVDLSAVVAKVEPVLRTTLGGHIALDVNMFAANIGVQADPAQLEQLITALAQRAARQMPRGGKLTIECSPLEITDDLRRSETVLRPGVYAVLRVEDTGPTPDPEARAAMFESIATRREATEENATILSRMYGFIRQWGGEISVSANSPQGAVFEVFLPRLAQPTRTAPPAHSASPANTPQSEPVHQTVLIAEGDAGIRALVKKILRAQNYTVIEAASPEEALKTAVEHARGIDLLITDTSAAQFGGEELAQQMMARQPGIRVLYLSGYAEAPPPGSAFLQKPFTLGSLLNKVKEVLPPEERT